MDQRPDGGARAVKRQCEGGRAGMRGDEDVTAAVEQGCMYVTVVRGDGGAL